jgi:hypothetical protein
MDSVWTLVIPTWTLAIGAIIQCWIFIIYSKKQIEAAHKARMAELAEALCEFWESQEMVESRRLVHEELQQFHQQASGTAGTQLQVGLYFKDKLLEYEGNNIEIFIKLGRLINFFQNLAAFWASGFLGVDLITYLFKPVITNYYIYFGEYIKYMCEKNPTDPLNLIRDLYNTVNQIGVRQTKTFWPFLRPH